MSQRSRRVGVVALCLTGIVGCSESASEPVAGDPAYAIGSALVECPSTTSYETSGSVLPLGGSVSLRGHSVALPLGAVIAPASIGIAEPASRYMLIDLSANGEDHWQFQAPITVTISYARCSRANIDKGPLSVWLVDPATGELLENMGGVDDKLTRTITFQTDHFSGYAIAN